MHNIGRTYQETYPETYGYETHQEGYGYEAQPETYGFEAQQEGYGYEMYPEAGGGLFTEAEEMELAAELLGISTEAELEQFLGNIFRRVARGVGSVIRSPIGRALGGVLKGVAKTALPIAGTALGNLVAPGVGGMIGGKLASAAASMFQLELEGLSPEDQEFEVARHYVRLAGEAARQAAMAPPNAAPQQVAQQALAAAARTHAPGLAAAQPGAGRNRGFWRRAGRTIVLYGA